MMHTQLIAELAQFPEAVKTALQGISNQQLLASYREGGWNILQIVNHLSDSHLNGFARHKFALTEERPTIKPYNQDAWASLADSNTDIHAALLLLEGVHLRWAQLLSSLDEEQWNRVYIHPEYGKTPTLAQSLQDYVNHGNGHLAQLKQAISNPVWAK